MNDLEFLNHFDSNPDFHPQEPTVQRVARQRDLIDAVCRQRSIPVVRLRHRKGRA